MEWLSTVWCWIAGDAETTRNVILSLGLLGGFYGLHLARQRRLLADQELRRERCQMGIELLSLNPKRYSARAAGASILANILDGTSTEYDETILRAFEATLFSPSVFGGNVGKHQAGETRL